jgi:hypothetical protein
MQVTDLKAKWKNPNDMEAHVAVLDGDKLTVDHPNWNLSDSTGRDLASKHTEFHLTGTMTVTVTIGSAPAAAAPAAAPALAGHRPPPPKTLPFNKTMKLTTWGGKTGRCVFQA